MRKIEIAMLLVVLLSFVFSAYFYTVLPDRIAIHWNGEGVADGFAEKGFGLFMLPVIAALIFGLFVLIPRIDPLKKNIAQFRDAYEKFAFLILAFMLYIHLVTLWINLGNELSIIQAMAPALGVLFFAMGDLLKHAKRNWFIGIRTPWTLSSDEVWDKTHKLGAPLFKASGAVAFLGLFFPAYFLYLIMVPILSTTVILTVYSYIEYKKLGK